MNSSIETSSTSSNRNCTNVRTAITETSSIQQVQSSDHHERRKEFNKNVTITGNSVSENLSLSAETQSEQKFQVFFDADTGLYIKDSTDKNLNKSYVFYNCNVRIESGSHQPIVFNNCNITNRDEETENEK